MNKFLPLISSFLIILAFFLGYLFAEEKQKSNNENMLKKQYINLEITKNKLEILGSSEQIEILVNGKRFSSGSIEIPE